MFQTTFCYYEENGVASGGAGCWAKGAGTAGKVVGYGVKAMDIGGNVVGAGKNVYDIYDNGPSLSNVAGLAGNGLGLAGNINMKCFTAGTQIVVGAEYDADGVFVQYVTVNIEDIKVGDLVYSYDTATGEVSLKAVTDTFVRTSDHINYLTIVDENGREQTIETTDGHPFWVVTDEPDLSHAARSVADGMYHEDVTPTEHGYWVEAKNLRIGDVFLGANGELSTLVAAERVSGGVTVYNFTVEGNHNYFIIARDDEFGQTCILVHNAEYTVTARRFVSRDEYKNIRKHGIPFDPDGHGIPATTPTVRPTNPDKIQSLTGANNTNYFVDLDITDIPHRMKRTKAGLPEITIMGTVPPEKVIGGGRVL